MFIAHLSGLAQSYNYLSGIHHPSNSHSYSRRELLSARGRSRTLSQHSPADLQLDATDLRPLICAEFLNIALLICLTNPTRLPPLNVLFI